MRENETEYIKLPKNDLKKMKLLPGNNKVLLRKLTDNINQKTKSGIYVSPKPLVQNIPDHADRVFEVVQAPIKLRFELPNRRGDIDKQHMYGQFTYFWTPAWKTNIEIKKGDIVITAKIKINRSVHIRCEEEVYVLLDYHELYLAFRPKVECAEFANNTEVENWVELSKIDKKWELNKKMDVSKIKFSLPPNTVEDMDKLIICGKIIEEIIPLNGFVICETIKDFLHSDIIWLPKNPDDRIKRGKVVYIGMPNERYMHKQDKDEGINLKKGQIIYKRNTLVHRDLENVLHSVFDKENEYFAIQRKDIIHAE